MINIIGINHNSLELAMRLWSLISLWPFILFPALFFHIYVSQTLQPCFRIPTKSIGSGIKLSARVLAQYSSTDF